LLKQTRTEQLINHYYFLHELNLTNLIQKHETLSLILESINEAGNLTGNISLSFNSSLLESLVFAIINTSSKFPRHILHQLLLYMLKEVVKLVWQNLTKTMYVMDHIQAVHLRD